VHDIDHPEVELQAPVLVTDADASQVSAVIDAAAGNSLVIQGPPGTGKSQTITNIIANAVWQGKSILFVSEKMAALGVVKDRLDHMGLGLFCLEVHSAKASKAQVLKALKERMDAGRVRSNAEEIERARTALQEARQRLTDYAGVINAPAGDTGLTTEYQSIRERFGPFDLVMLEVGAFHPSWGDMHLGPENALKALALLGGGTFLPIHWGTFALGMHPWDQPAETLLQLAPRSGAQLMMPRLGAPTEPAHAEVVEPWWREAKARRRRRGLGSLVGGTLPKTLPWPLD